MSTESGPAEEPAETPAAKPVRRRKAAGSPAPGSAGSPPAGPPVLVVTELDGDRIRLEVTGQPDEWVVCAQAEWRAFLGVAVVEDVHAVSLGRDGLQVRVTPAAYAVIWHADPLMGGSLWLTGEQWTQLVEQVRAKVYA